MAAHGWSRRFRFPGYDGALPKALRSLRGRGKYQQKVNKPPRDWGLFELLATVAGQVLQEKYLNEDEATIQIACTKGKEKATENEEVSQAATGFKQCPQAGIDGKLTGGSYKSKNIEDIEITSTEFESRVKDYTKRGFGESESVEETQNPYSDVPLLVSKEKSNEWDSKEKTTNTMDGIVESRVAELRRTVWKNTNLESSESNHLDLVAHPEGQEQSDRLGSEEGSCTTLRHPSVLSCDSIEEDSTSVHTKPCEFVTIITSEKNLDSKQKLVCATAKDDDDNFSVSIPSKGASPKSSSQKLLVKELRQEELHLGSMRIESLTTIGSKRKFSHTMAKDARIGSSPHSNTKTAWRGAKSSTRDSQVKVNITSFTVPELCIDLPKTATVANLKRAVMDAAINVLGRGLHVRVLHQGKKVADESTTLVQMGISKHERLDSLAFMLEPDCVADTTMHEKNPVFSLSNASNESTIWYPIFSLSDDKGEVKGKTLSGEPCECVTMDVQHKLATQGESNGAIEPGWGLKPHQYIPGQAPLVLFGPLILHPGLKDTEAMNIVRADQSFQGTNSGKRRVRRPFTVIEVAALVQAVELLGTGRWREIKQQAFDHARHRTYVDLKDKWKTLVHTAHIAPHQRRGEPVPQELLDRVLKAHTYWAAQQAKQQAIPGT